MISPIKSKKYRLEIKRNENKKLEIWFHHSRRARVKIPIGASGGGTRHEGVFAGAERTSEWRDF